MIPVALVVALSVAVCTFDTRFPPLPEDGGSVDGSPGDGGLADGGAADGGGDLLPRVFQASGTRAELGGPTGSSEQVTSVVLDGEGNLFFAAVTDATELVLGRNSAGDPVRVTGSLDTPTTVVAKLDWASGHLAWVVTVAGTIERPQLALFDSHRLYFSGTFTDDTVAVTPGTGDPFSLTKITPRTHDGFLLRINVNSGAAVWDSVLGASVGDLATDGSGNIYLAGRADPGEDSYCGRGLPPILTGRALLAARFTPGGSCEWATAVVSDVDAGAPRIETSAAGIFLAGGILGTYTTTATRLAANRSLVVVRLDPLTGIFGWDFKTAGAAVRHALELEIGAADRLFFAAASLNNQALIVGPFTFPVLPGASENYFFGELDDTTGTLVWADRRGMSGVTEVSAFRTVNGGDDLFFAGELDGTLTLDDGDLSCATCAAGVHFLARVDRPASSWGGLAPGELQTRAIADDQGDLYLGGSIFGAATLPPDDVPVPTSTDNDLIIWRFLLTAASSE